MLEQLVNHMRARKGIVFARCDELVEHLRRSSGHV
jgi:hypothetical protein